MIWMRQMRRRRKKTNAIQESQCKALLLYGEKRYKNYDTTTTMPFGVKKCGWYKLEEYSRGQRGGCFHRYTSHLLTYDAKSRCKKANAESLPTEHDFRWIVAIVFACVTERIIE